MNAIEMVQSILKWSAYVREPKLEKINNGVFKRVSANNDFTVPMGWAVSYCLLALEILLFGELIHPLSFFVVSPPIALTMAALLFGGVDQ